MGFEPWMWCYWAKTKKQNKTKTFGYDTHCCRGAGEARTLGSLKFMMYEIVLLYVTHQANKDIQRQAWTDFILGVHFTKISCLPVAMHEMACIAPPSHRKTRISYPFQWHHACMRWCVWDIARIELGFTQFHVVWCDNLRETETETERQRESDQLFGDWWDR